MENYKTVILLLDGDSGDRRTLEQIEGDTFESIEDIQKAICFDENNPIVTEDLRILDLSDFTQNCNDTDSDSIEQGWETNVELAGTWIGYVLLKIK